jgi:prepilin-type N-terminal cleavage/methylation domain-containing protein
VGTLSGYAYHWLTMREEYTKRSRGNAASKGFSLTEIIVVLAIVMTLAGVAFPIFTKISYNTRLKSAATNLSGLMQQARIQAARQNAVYTVVIPSTGGQAFINLNPGTNSTWDSGEPVIRFNSNITPASSAPTGSGSQPSAYTLVGDTTGGTPYDNATTLGYSPRGLPCAYVSSTCSTPAADYFVYYLRDARPDGTTGWAAVVVTRTGRTKSYTWNGASWN